MEGFLCPKCSNRAMRKKEVKKGTYQLVCSTCGFQHKTLPKDESKKGFV